MAGSMVYQGSGAIRMKAYMDLETNMAHDTIWCASHATDQNPVDVTRDRQTVANLVNQADEIINHNIIGFDGPVLRKVWNIKVPFRKMVDTLVLSRLYDPSMEGGHSLENWGKKLRCAKGDFRDYDAGYSEEMADYAKQDVVLNRKVYQQLMADLNREEFSQDSILLEHQVAYVIEQQVARGVFFDYCKCEDLLAAVSADMEIIENQLHKVFPPIVTPRISEKTGKPLKDSVEIFNVGSRQQIAKRLESLGVVFTSRTESGIAKVDETILEAIDLPEAKLIAQYLTLQKRQSQLSQWLNYCGVSGRIHGRVITNGAVTGRMTHAKPNLAQVPACGSYLGKECRELFLPSIGYVMVGIDAAALELCMLAHYMRDAEFTEAVVSGTKEAGTDVHTRNMKAAGLNSRDQAKTFIYAFLYGAGSGKIGTIIGGGAKEGQKLIETFMENMPSLAALKKKVDDKSCRAGAVLQGLDGRQLRIRSPHAALNTLLQGAGAVVMKKALVIFYNKIKKEKLDAHFVLNVHDEWQLECRPDQAERVGQLGLESIKEAGEALSVRCPLSGEVKIGKSWADTH